MRLGFRGTDALAERVIYREFFPRGLTALDNVDERTFGTRSSLSHVTARGELIRLIETLKLPLDERGQRGRPRMPHGSPADKPLELHDVIAQ